MAPVRCADDALGQPAAARTVVRDTDTTRNNFDLIRLFAASQVALKHALVHLEVDDRYIEILSIFPGVPIFFLISGFLIYQSLVNTRSLAAFATNRVLRIYPALIVCFVFSVLVVVASGYLDWRQVASRPFLAWALSQLTIVQIYNPEFLRSFGIGVINGSLWTISVELQFYLLAPVLAWIVARRNAAWPFVLALFVAANVLLTLWTSTGFPRKLFSVSFPPWFYMFVLGAYISTRPDWVQRIRATRLWVFAAAYLFVAAAGWALGATVIGNEVNPVSYMFLAALVLKLAHSMPDLSSRLLRKNDISYGVYIYHMPLINLLVYLGWTGSGPAVVLAMLATYALALFSWVLVERPALALKRYTLRRY